MVVPSPVLDLVDLLLEDLDSQQDVPAPRQCWQWIVSLACADSYADLALYELVVRLRDEWGLDLAYLRTPAGNYAITGDLDKAQIATVTSALLDLWRERRTPVLKSAPGAYVGTL